MELSYSKLTNKINILLVAILVFSLKIQAQKVTVFNSSWSNPFMWSPPGPPLSSDSVTINHNVIVDTDIFFNSGSLTVSPGASLSESPFIPKRINLISTQLNNKGTIVISYLTSTNDFIDNQDSIYVKKVFNTYGTSTTNSNSGKIYVGDSLSINGSGLTNYGIVTGNFIYNKGTIKNNKRISTNYLQSDVSFINNDTVIVSKNWIEKGTFKNYLYADIADTFHIYSGGSVENYIVVTTGNFLWLDGTLDNSGTFTVPVIKVDTNGALNNNPKGIVVTTGNFIYNYGDMSLFNYSVIKTKNIISSGRIMGAFGCILISDSSNVSGIIDGSIDFCDATPPSTSPPIDVFTGTVSSLVTFCTSNCSSVGIKDKLDKTISVAAYPNPVTDAVTLSWTVKEKGIYIIEMYDIIGQKVYANSLEINSIDYKFEVPCNNLTAGTYLLTVKNEIIFYKKLFLKIE
ncbi:MAG: T9SS type A sorting domain-containing protein [Bacteroidetes bacterium]|nr:T9SS type A sorting domain-containing protein [Bacteroidota bacterium]